MANASLRDEEKIKEGIKRADFVRKGMSLTHETGFERGGKCSSPKKAADIVSTEIEAL